MDYAEKVRKLFAMAEDPSLNEAARENYRIKAEELMVTWAIDDAQLITEGNDRLKNEKIIRREYVPAGPKTYSYEWAYMIYVAAEAVGLRAAIGKDYYNRGMSIVVLVGFESDVDRFTMLADSLVRQCATSLGAWARDLASYLSPSEKYNERRGFIKGFGTRVSKRLEVLHASQVTEHTKSSGNGAELVLVDRKAQLEQHVSTLGWTTGRGRKSGVHGRYAGDKAGAKADIGQSRFGSGAGARGSLDG